MTITTDKELLIREDLSDYISNLYPAEVPLQSFCGKYPMKQKFTEYGIDSFNITRTIASIASNVKTEGATFTTTDGIDPSRLKAMAQINWKAIAVSGTDRASNIAGMSDPFEYRLYKTMVEVANDQELALLWGSGNYFGNTAATARQTEGLVHWCASSGLARTLGVNPVSTNYINSLDGASNANNLISGAYWSNFYNAAGVNMDLSILTDKILGGAVDNGFQVEGSVGMCGRKVKALIANFALTVNGPLNTRWIAAGENAISENVQWIETASFGTLGVVYNRYFDLANQAMSLNNTNTNGTPPTGGTVVSGTFNSSFPCSETFLAFMPQYIKVGTLRGLGWAPMPRTIDGDQGAVVGELGLVCLNPLAVTGGTNLLAA